MPGFVFLCYSHADAGYASMLAEFLRQSGIEIWLDDEIISGERWSQLIAARIDNCAAVLVLMSPASEESPWVSREITRAEQRHKLIFPLLVAGDSPFFRLSDLQYVNVTGGRMPPPGFVSRLQGILRTHPLESTPASDPTIGPTIDDPGRTHIFVNYRRTDTAFGAHWLFNHLTNRFEASGSVSRQAIFMDVDTITIGRDFEVAVKTAIEQCRMMLILIGSNWLEARDVEGGRRLDDPDDMVRREIEIGLECDVVMVPVLLSPAHMPPAKILPVSIRKVATRHAATLRPEHFVQDADWLYNQVLSILALETPPKPTRFA